MLIFDTGSEENSASPIMTAPATVAASFNSEALEANSNETAIHYSRPATIFAAVAASIFTFVGITGKNFDSHLGTSDRSGSGMFYCGHGLFSFQHLVAS